MQQKVQFATALVHEPELLILDEPWSGLDPINADVLRAVVEEVRAAGRTVLFSTHLMEQAEKVCDAVCIIARGAKVLDGRLDEVKRAAARDRSIALACADAAARGLADGPLSDRALVANVVDGVDGSLDVTVELAPGARPQALLAALVAAGVDLTRFEVVVPSLHQIFVERVSHGSGA
jgi:ABC-2 type transport system ATP-binding protein